MVRHCIIKAIEIQSRLFLGDIHVRLCTTSKKSVQNFLSIPTVILTTIVDIKNLFQDKYILDKNICNTLDKHVNTLDLLF